MSSSPLKSLNGYNPHSTRPSCARLALCSTMSVLRHSPSTRRHTTDAALCVSASERQSALLLSSTILVADHSPSSPSKSSCSTAVSGFTSLGACCAAAGVAASRSMYACALAWDIPEAVTSHHRGSAVGYGPALEAMRARVHSRDTTAAASRLASSGACCAAAGVAASWSVCACSLACCTRLGTIGRRPPPRPPVVLPRAGAATAGGSATAGASQLPAASSVAAAAGTSG